MQKCHVYILTNKNHTVLYVGVTSDIRKRMHQHKTKYYKGFTARYNVDKLVNFETFNDIRTAIEREKQLKAGSRAKKEALIHEMNPEWVELDYH